MSVGKLFCSCLSTKSIRHQHRNNRHHNAINDKEQWEKERKQRSREIRILLLGTAESGKSTFIKQMHILYGEQFSREELDAYRQLIYTNIIHNLQRVLRHTQLPTSLTHLSRGDIDSVAFSINVAPLIKQLWSNEQVQQIWQRRNELQLNESLQYFCSNIDRIGSPTYTPTHNDILHSRQETRCVQEFNVFIHKQPFVFIDVGGQRTERQKWLECFANCQLILFMVGTSEFDQQLKEDPTKNRLRESIELYSTIVCHRFLSRIRTILFLNKHDLLIDKVLSPTSQTIDQTFPEFDGNNVHNVDQVKNFIAQLFLRQSSSNYIHWTTAIDTNSIKVVFDTVRLTILQKNINDILM